MMTAELDLLLTCASISSAVWDRGLVGSRVEAELPQFVVVGVGEERGEGEQEVQGEAVAVGTGDEHGERVG